MGNHFLSSYKKFMEDRIAGGKVELFDFDCFSVKGLDAFEFLQGQLASDILLAETEKKVILCSRINREGKLKSFFYLYKIEDYFRLLIPSSLAKDTILDLQKFIISEDVEIEELTILHTFVFGESSSVFVDEMKAEIFNEEGHLVLNTEDSRLQELPIVNASVLEIIKFLNFWPSSNDTRLFIEKFSWETPFAKSLSLSKGCYLGQESVNKVLSGRGANYFPGLLLSSSQFNLQRNLCDGAEGKIIKYGGEAVGEILSYCFFDEFKIYACVVKREFRINNKEFEFELGGKKILAKFYNFPLFNFNLNSGKSEYLQNIGQKLFVNDETDKAISCLRQSLHFNPENLESLESLGVIYLRIEKFIEAIICFDKLIELSPTSPLPHTNKSIIFAKQGKIEEAEKEKEQAVLKEFQKNNNLHGPDQVAEKEDMVREEMFLDVLIIDPDDSFANYGLAEINFKRKNLEEAKMYLNKLLIIKSNDYNALFLMGKILLENGKVLEGLDYFRKTVTAAAAKGDLKIANLAQGYL